MADRFYSYTPDGYDPYNFNWAVKLEYKQLAHWSSWIQTVCTLVVLLKEFFETVDFEKRSPCSAVDKPLP